MAAVELVDAYGYYLGIISDFVREAIDFLVQNDKRRNPVKFYVRSNEEELTLSLPMLALHHLFPNISYRHRTRPKPIIIYAEAYEFILKRMKGHPLTWMKHRLP